MHRMGPCASTQPARICTQAKPPVRCALPPQTPRVAGLLGLLLAHQLPEDRSPVRSQSPAADYDCRSRLGSPSPTPPPGLPAQWAARAARRHRRADSPVAPKREGREGPQEGSRARRGQWRRQRPTLRAWSGRPIGGPSRVPVVRAAAATGRAPRISEGARLELAQQPPPGADPRLHRVPHRRGVGRPGRTHAGAGGGGPLPRLGGHFPPPPPLAIAGLQRGLLEERHPHRGGRLLSLGQHCRGLRPLARGGGRRLPREVPRVEQGRPGAHRPADCHPRPGGGAGEGFLHHCGQRWECRAALWEERGSAPTLEEVQQRALEARVELWEQAAEASGALGPMLARLGRTCASLPTMRSRLTTTRTSAT